MTMQRLPITMTLPALAALAALAPSIASAQDTGATPGSSATVSASPRAKPGDGVAPRVQEPVKQPTPHRPPQASAAPIPIRHLPLNELESGAARVRFSIPEPDRTGTVVVHWSRTDDPKASGEASARRTQSGYVARIPTAVVQPPSFEYWVSERLADKSERPVFASARAPHRVRVFHSDARRSELARLRSRAGKRSSLLGGAEYVDFGKRRLQSSGGELPDRYYQLHTGYAYAFLSSVEEIELRVVRVRGEAARLEDLSPGNLVQRVDPGIDYGRATVTLLVVDGIRLRGSVLLGASQEGFEYGTGGALIFGDPRSIHVTLSAEGLTTLGFTAGMRMGFMAAERLPMGAGVEVSNFPVGDDAGVRLIYDVGYELIPGSVLILRTGFQGRTSVTGGPTVGLGFRYGF